MDHFRRPSPRQRDGPSGSHSQALSRVPPTTTRQPHEAEISNDAQRAEYARALLAQYRKHVATTLEPELARLKNENSELKFDSETAAERIHELQHRLRVVEEDLVELRRQQSRSKDDAEIQLRRVNESAADRLALQSKVSQLEIDQLRNELKRTQDALTRAKEQGGDPSVASKLADAMREISELAQSRDALVAKHRCLQDAYNQLEQKQIGTSGVLNVVASAATELLSMVRESSDFGTGVCTAFGLMDCECQEVSTAASQWRALGATCAVDEGRVESDGFIRLRKDADELVMLAAGCRAAISQEHQGLAAALKRMIIRHTEVLEAAASVEHQRQKEKDLSRRRLTELEDDRKAERESMLTALEKERVKNRLASVVGPAVTYSLSGPGSPSGGLHPRKAVPAVHVAAQTGAELLDVHSEQQQTARLLLEVVSLQSQIAHYRETIQLLEAQRKLFMDFVDDSSVANHVAQALHEDGMPSSEEFMVHGV